MKSMRDGNLYLVPLQIIERILRGLSEMFVDTREADSKMAQFKCLFYRIVKLYFMNILNNIIHKIDKTICT